MNSPQETHDTVKAIFDYKEDIKVGFHPIKWAINNYKESKLVFFIGAWLIFIWSWVIIIPILGFIFNFNIWHIWPFSSDTQPLYWSSFQ